MEVHLSPWQTKVFDDQHRFRIVCAGRRSGKSVLARLIVLNWAASQIGTYWIVSPTYKQSKQIHWREIMKEVPNGWIKAKNEVELSLTLHNGSIIELKGAENPDTLRGIKLRGLVIDEIASIRNWDWLWAEVLRPTLTDYSAPALFISTPKGFNHFYELFTVGQNSKGDYQSWRFTSYDNPYISKEEIDNAKNELMEDTFAQEYLADFRKFVGLVYKDFNREIHVKELPDFKPVFWVRGCDRGFRNPTGVPWIQVDKDGVWYQTHELYGAGWTNPELARLLKQQRGEIIPEYSTMDSAQASDIADLASLGEDFIPVKKEPGEQNKSYVEYKIQKFAERLKIKGDGRPGYYVHPRCENTIKEFESYRWKERRQGEATDLNLINEPEKANDHCLLGSTLVDTLEGQKTIMGLVGKSGYLNTLGGLKKFNGVRLTQKQAKVCRVSFDNGKTIECTPDHLFLTTDGWIEARFLEGYDVVDIGSMGLIQYKTNGVKDINIFSRIQRKAVLLLRALLSTGWSEASSGCLDGRPRLHPERLTHTSQRRKQGKQQTGKFRDGEGRRSLVKAHDSRAKIVGGSKHEGKSSSDGGQVARVSGWDSMAQKAWEEYLEGAGFDKKELRTLQKGISNAISHKVQFLLKQVCHKKTAKCADVQGIGNAPVYNLEVEGTHCFSVNGGVIVHNCMDALADLNAMYLHEYIEIKKKPWEGKVPGTYVPPAIIEEESGWTTEPKTSLMDI